MILGQFLQSVSKPIDVVNRIGRGVSFSVRGLHNSAPEERPSERGEDASAFLRLNLAF